MIDWISVWPTVLASFAASMVEFVEALTVVLAVGAVRGWRSALMGTAFALGALALLVVVIGRSLANVPLALLQLVIGTLLLLFGLRWLRKAILRAAGVLSLHDEDAAYASQADALGRDRRTPVGVFDPVGFGAAFKIVILEGIEVVFIVLALGAGSNSIIPASAGAVLGLLVVTALGVVLHRPLSRIPENTLKFGVGIMLSAFGMFWVGEGIGLRWPAQDWSIVALIAILLATSLILVHECRRIFQRGRHKPVRRVNPAGGIASAAWRSMGLFIEDVGLALGVVCWIVLWRMIPVADALTTWPADIVFVAGLIAFLTFSLRRGAEN